MELHRLDAACAELDAFACLHDGRVYLVGSVNTEENYRDVDVRMMLPDDAFDALFGHSQGLWSLFCYATSRQLAADTELRIDFQVQRQSEANAKHEGPRNPLGRRALWFAGGGDATRFGAKETPV